MRIVPHGALGVALLLASIPQAQAFGFGEVCHAHLWARGSKKLGESAARSSAILHWQKAAARKHGRGFADWWYSGDRQFSCNWDKSGRWFLCLASARPCGRR